MRNLLANISPRLIPLGSLVERFSPITAAVSAVAAKLSFVVATMVLSTTICSSCFFIRSSFGFKAVPWVWLSGPYPCGAAPKQAPVPECLFFAGTQLLAQVVYDVIDQAIAQSYLAFVLSCLKALRYIKKVGIHKHFIDAFSIQFC